MENPSTKEKRLRLRCRSASSCPGSGNGRGEAGEAAGFDEGQDDEQPTHELDVEEEPVCTFARTPKKRRGSPAPARKFSL